MKSMLLNPKSIFLILIIFGIFSLAKSSWAACSWNGNIGIPADLSVTEITSCINDASSCATNGSSGCVAADGAVTIMLPAGISVTWSSNLDIDMSSGFDNVQSLKIIGAGNIPTGSATGASISNGSTVTLSGTAKVNFNGITDKKFRLGNITFGGSNNGFAISITGTSKYSSGGGWRIDHVTFNNTDSGGNSDALNVEGVTYGVVDHCYRNYPHQVFNVSQLAGNMQNAQHSWETDDFDGTGNAVYFEDNEIYCDTGCSSPVMFSDGNNGARIVYRHNKIRNHYIGWHDTLMNRGTFWTEIYDNDFYWTKTGGMSGDTFDLRGGTGVCYNNTIHCDQNSASQCWYSSFSGNSGIHMTSYRAYTGSNPPYPAPGTGNLHDPPYIMQQSCYDAQSPWKGCFGVGAIASDYQCNTEEDCGGNTGVTNYCVYVDNQDGNGKGYPCRDQIGRSIGNTLRPYLFWNNTVQFASNNPVEAIPGVDYLVTEFIQENRDYCNDATTMPSSCNGVTTKYMPFSYPHPLQNEDSDTTPPAAPSGLTVN